MYVYEFFCCISNSFVCSLLLVSSSSPSLRKDKQFNYRKLANEGKSKIKPLRPPQPKLINNTSREELLIDISPDDNSILQKSSVTQASPRSISLLDEPIDMPQEGKRNFIRMNLFNCIIMYGKFYL